MITVKDLKDLKENDGLTLKNYEPVNYKTGYQVATEGIETENPMEALKSIKDYNGNCGVWYSNGVYYIDRSKRITTRREALEIGKLHNQQSILKWQSMSLVWI